MYHFTAGGLQTDNSLISVALINGCAGFGIKGLIGVVLICEDFYSDTRLIIRGYQY